MTRTGEAQAKTQILQAGTPVVDQNPHRKKQPKPKSIGLITIEGCR